MKEHKSTNTYFSSNIVIVLVGTSDPGNIGASARAMKTMGLTKLRLVNPLYFPHPKATWRSAHAKDIVDNAKTYPSLETAIADCHIVMATSARSRSLPWPLYSVEEAAKKVKLSLEQNTKNKIAIIFGRESSGLTNNELQMCNYHLSINANLDYPILNLSHAVQIVCHEIFKAFHNKATQSTNHFGVEWDQELAKNNDLNAMIKELEKTLINTGFYNPKNPDKLIPRIKRLFFRTGLDTMEVNIMRGIISHINNISDRAKK